MMQKKGNLQNIICRATEIDTNGHIDILLSVRGLYPAELMLPFDNWDLHTSESCFLAAGDQTPSLACKPGLHWLHDLIADRRPDDAQFILRQQ